MFALDATFVDQCPLCGLQPQHRDDLVNGCYGPLCPNWMRASRTCCAYSIGDCGHEMTDAVLSIDVYELNKAAIAVLV
ncbi:hypothetical protein Q5Y75_25710 [Ruegeria sp. 2205SS24-7]|uniref:hypothetical protein n=1 Tax=Ruegeria discodermiae TaxID=3064389 RepID=UPI0027411772|nr:hypothetical protein [Ruegeria sp. 2205SS24-7]MDP5220588.1 hypothetical protein [Ruegeria sp. 2205SS24-7]